ncbi:hypothetical protein SAMN05428976_11525 [Clostridium sp. USBA 49]|nr:hypothetical protein SAMN05428976_11525 [Clostridium sp. USBA 49]
MPWNYGFFMTLIFLNTINLYLKNCGLLSILIKRALVPY